MKMKNGFDNDIIVGIDIGSENIFCSIGSIENENNKVKVLGLGTAPVLDSFKKGAITNRNNLIEQLEIAVTAAESMADKKVDSAYMTITGDHIRCMSTQGAIALNRNMFHIAIAKGSQKEKEFFFRKTMRRIKKLRKLLGYKQIFA